MFSLKQRKRSKRGWTQTRDINHHETRQYLVLNTAVPSSVWCQMHSLDVGLRIAAKQEHSQSVRLKEGNVIIKTVRKCVSYTHSEGSRSEWNVSTLLLLYNDEEKEACFVFRVWTSGIKQRCWSCLPGAARWPCCAASLCTAEQPEWGPVVGDQGSETEDWMRASYTGQPRNRMYGQTVFSSDLLNESNRLCLSHRNFTWLVYMARRALLRSMAWSCFFTSLYSTPSAFVSFTFFFESNTFWSWENKQCDIRQWI